MNIYKGECFFMWYTKTINEIEKNFRTNREYGITEEEAKIRQTTYGKNKLQEGKKTSIFIKFLKQAVKDFLIC